MFDLGPGNATLNIQITEVNSTNVNISWNALPVCFQGADGFGYKLMSKHVATTNSTMLTNYTNATSYIFMEFWQFEKYEITITPTNNDGEGVPLTKNSMTPQGRKLILG